MARLRQRNALGECQTCGLWPNNAQEATATCPTGFTGEPVTVTIAAGTFFADTTENADELALEEAQEQAQAALQCVGPDYFCETGNPAMEPAVAPAIYDVYAVGFGIGIGAGTVPPFRGILSEDGKKVAVATVAPDGPVVFWFGPVLVFDVNGGLFDSFVDEVSLSQTPTLTGMNRDYDISGSNQLGEGAFEGLVLNAPTYNPPVLGPLSVTHTSIANDGTTSTARLFDRCSGRRISYGSLEEKDGEGNWFGIAVPTPDGLTSFSICTMAGSGSRIFATALQEGSPVLVILDDMDVTEIVPFPSGVAETGDVYGCASGGSSCYGLDWIWTEADGIRPLTTVLSDAGLSVDPQWDLLQMNEYMMMSATGQHFIINATKTDTSYETVLYVVIP